METEQGLKNIAANSSFELIIFLTHLTSKDMKPFNALCVTFAYIHALFLFFPPSACSLLFSSFYLSGTVSQLAKYSDG